ncbi:MAG TPA: TetR/AcrR family transcriptional regulator [Acidimicrobiales bacterium]|nr:TetR/AcrR family transcriptional regulator [Acidimicrobiales bacterium]
MATRQPDGSSTAERVERAALRLFAIRGFEGTGIRSIADEAGITLGSLYHYIGTKEDLLDRLMHKSMLGLLGPGREIVETVADPRERIVKLVDLHVRRHAEDNLLSIVGDAEIRSLTPARRRKAVALRDSYESLWEETIDAGSRSGDFHVPDVKLATFALIEMCSGVAYWYSSNGRLPLDAISKAFVEMTLNLLGVEPVPPPAARGRRAARS